METGQKRMAQTTNTNNKPTILELSIQISLSGLSFCVLSIENRTIIALKSFDFEKKGNPFEVLDRLKQLFNTETDLKHTFNAVKIIHENDLSTLVPKSVFKEDCLADYLKFNSKILKSDFIAYDTIAINNSVNVYVPYVNINNFIYEKFGAFTYKHSSTILIESILRDEEKSEIPKIYTHISGDHFEMIIVENSKLILYNTFEYSTKEDFIYFVLFTAEQLKIDTETCHLIFLGDAIANNDALYKMAYKYIRHVSFGNRNDDYTYQEQPKTEYSNFTLIKSF